MSDNIEQPVQPSNEPMKVSPVKKRGMKKIIGYAVLAFAVLAVALTFFVNSATKAPVAASQQFLHAIQAGDATTAYALFSVEAKKVVPSDQFDALVKQVAPIFNTGEKMLSKKVNSSTGSAATSEVVYQIKGTDGKTYKFTVNLTKEGDVWKVLNFTSKAQ